MKKQSRHTIELSLDLTTLNSYGRNLNPPQCPNLDSQPQEPQENQPVCNNGACELIWKPGRQSVA